MSQFTPSREVQCPEKVITQMSISGDMKTLTIHRQDGMPLTYKDVEILFRGSPMVKDKLRHLRCLLPAGECRYCGKRACSCINGA